MNSEKAQLTDQAGNVVADLLLSAEEDGWFSGTLESARLPAEIKQALDWYDEVVENQMLAYLDEATARVEGFKLRFRSNTGKDWKVYSLHIDKGGNVSFRTTPVPPPAWVAQD